MVMALFGRVAGITGVTMGALGQLAPPGGRAEDWGWRIAFVAGLIAAPLVWTVLSGGPVVQTISANLPMMVLAGLLVGLGTAIGSGCTSDMACEVSSNSSCS